MLRSMYAGISGMKGFQTKLDTIGNNIANVNTYGYKKGRVTFQDMLSQTVSGAEGPNQNAGVGPGNVRGGINPSQVGLGSQMGSIDTIHTQGSRQTTNRPLDLSLEGDGMFVLGEGGNNGSIDPTAAIADLSQVNTTFTRSGNFYLDNNGAIVNNEGKYVLGEQAANGALNGSLGPITIPNNAQSFSVQSDGQVKYIDTNGETQVAGQIRLANFSNVSGLKKVGGNAFQNTDNAGIYTANNDGNFNGLNDLIVAGQDGTGSMLAGSLEMSNVDLAESFTEMITAQRGFQANTRIITTSDEILQELVNLKR
ncbi:flagellar basal body rod protein FlgG [Halobacillus yeomjeoni]|uniref:flagellar basal body rod protein FlgG n=1 Tax=Halobacillus yeomjeoni TaxID=311194 RepID=UPI001CD73C4E|nr:flagellar basal body rod protein FlgG [Halobacillus yeomjeoni]MCA0983323.1 flagellar basal body rod protein FlgG [Halobacillus yeomjeoni]